MDGKRFDTVTRGLAVAASRRRVLGGLLGGIVSVPAGGTAFAAKNRKRKGRGNGRGADDDAVAPGTLVGGVFEESLSVCHFDAESGDYEVIAVSPVSIPDYLNQGDTLFIDCCVDTDCGILPCFTTEGCTEGACAYNPTEGAPCAVEDGTTGACDADGICVAAAVAPPVS